MAKLLYTNIIGSFIINTNNQIIDKILFNSAADYINREKAAIKLKNKYRHAKEPSQKQLQNIANLFHTKEYRHRFTSMNTLVTKKLIAESVKKDTLLIQAANAIQEIDRTANTIVKRLREWYALYNPEFEKSLRDNERFVELILKKGKNQLLRTVDAAGSMGGQLDKTDLNAIKSLAVQLKEFYKLRKTQEKYIEGVMKSYCPDLYAVAGAMIGAKLIEHAGGLGKLALFPASTIQLLGAEKALFRHLKTKARCPKHGIIINHPLVSCAKRKDKGRAARLLSNKIAIAVKVDYYNGKFIGNKLKKELETEIKRN